MSLQNDSQASASFLSSTPWVGAWYAAPTRMPTANLSGRTLRQIVHLHAGGAQVRLHLSNRYGEDAVTLTSLSIGQVAAGPMLRPGEQTLHFSGQPAVTLEPGQEAVSDPVPLQVEAMSDLAITFFLARGEGLTGHAGAQQTSYLSSQSDMTKMHLPAEVAFLLYPLLTTSWWLISGVDVLPSTPLHALVAFGSSTTDGFGSTLNVNRRWPDFLARRLQEAGGTRAMSVLNAGIGGNQLTSALNPFPPESGLPPLLFGEAGNRRFAWDVLGQTGASDLILHIGSNDLRFGAPASTLIETFQQVAQQARKMYRRVFGTTILPGGYTPEQAIQRRLVNTWIREQSGAYFDATFDFATPLRSPEDETVLHSAYDSGDGIHPNDEGYRLMAAAVDISQLSGSPQQMA